MKIGDIGFWAHIETFEKQRDCPDCFGRKKLTVILGDDSTVEIDCAGCAIGYDPPRGFVTYRESKPIVEAVVIERIEESADGKEYGFRGCYRCKDLFETETEAQARAVELGKEYNREQIARLERKEKDTRSWSWHVTYHRRGIKEAQRNLEYHSKKLVIARTKAKES